MSGVTATTAVIAAAAITAAASIATTLMADKPASAGGSALKALGEWKAEDFGLDLGNDSNGGVLEFDSGSEDDNLAPSEGANVGIPDLQEGGDALENNILSTSATSTAPTSTRTSSDTPSKAGGMLDFVKDNQLLLGGVAKGLGAGISGYMQAESAKEIADRRARADSELLAQRDQQTTAKWAGTTPGMLNVGTAQRTPGPTPVQKYDPPAYRGSYVWDPQANKFVFVQQPTAGA
jgi:hypothetical protein